MELNIYLVCSLVIYNGPLLNCILLAAVAGMPQVLTAIEYFRAEARQDLEALHKVHFNLPGCAGFTN